jgi:isoprenylcysteine carboxyl methyltransferase (ICMT) family protein YpbQ
MSLSFDEFTRPTLNILIALSSALGNFNKTNKNPIDFNSLPIIELTNTINEYVIEYVLGNIRWKPQYYPKMDILHSIIYDSLIINVKTRNISFEYHCIELLRFQQTTSTRYWICGCPIDKAYHTKVVKLLSNEKVQDYITEWERNPTIYSRIRINHMLAGI